jgi:hypothetical protein
MLLRRIVEHQRAGNWFAVTLDLLVVVLGVFLALQAERWYDERRAASQEQIHLADLAEDFELTQQNIKNQHKRMSEAAQSAVTLLDARSRSTDAIKLSNKEFYSLLQATLRGATLAPVRRTYDVLIATGDISTIKDRSLKRALAQFYEQSSWQRIIDLREHQQENIVDPWIIYNFDHIALMRENHPKAEDTATMTSVHSADQFKSEMVTADFEAMMTATWHSAYEVTRIYDSALEQIHAIQKMIAINLAVTEVD